MVIIQVKTIQSLVTIHAFDIIETEKFIDFRIEHVFCPIEITIFHHTVIVDNQPKRRTVFDFVQDVETFPATQVVPAFTLVSEFDVTFGHICFANITL